MHFGKILFSCFLFLFGCQQAALVLHQQKITPSYLASTNIGSPDPQTPPKGEMIVAEWWLPRKALRYDPVLRIEILFRNYTQTCVEFPIHSVVGYKTFCLINEKFKNTKGLLAYKAEIISCDGDVFAKWKHQLWVRLISVDTEEISSAVKEKSIQGSVIDTPG